MNLKISEGLKNVFKLSSGTLIGQIISIVTLPIFTRVYGANIIGQWAMINSIAMVINSYSDLGLKNAIMIEDNYQDAYLIYKIVSTISLLISLISGIIYLIYCFVVRNYSDLLLDSLLIVIWSFLLQQIQISYTWLNRNKRYDILMKNPIINNLSLTFFGIMFYFTGLRFVGYYLGMILGQFMTLMHMKLYLPRDMFCFKITSFKKIFNKYIEFIKYQMPSTILLQIKSQLPTIIFGAFFGKKLLGYYSVAMRLLNLPTTFLANSLGKVYFQRVSELKNNINSIGEFTLRSLNISLKFCLPLIVFIVTFADILFRLFFGAEYIISGNMTRLMAMYGLFLFLSMSVSGVAIVIHKQQYMLISGILQIICILLSFFIGYIFDSVYLSIILHSITFMFIQIIFFCFIFKATQINIRYYILPLIKYSIIGIVIYIFIRIVLISIGMVESL